MVLPVPESCPCEDFEEDGDIGGDEFCVCGHLYEEHDDGFFMRCSYNTQDDEEGEPDGIIRPRKKPLPKATKQPCNDCPWRRKSAPGWLGPLTAEEWRALAHSDEPIACHVTIEVEDSWTAGNVRQCAGAAQYRRNIAKRPRDEQIAVAPEVDRDTVFGVPSEFIAHHTREG